MIVNPWAKLTPCGMVRHEFDSREDLVREFSEHNTCDKCFTAIRVNSEKPLFQMIKDGLGSTRRFSLKEDAT